MVGLTAASVGGLGPAATAAVVAPPLVGTVLTADGLPVRQALVLASVIDTRTATASGRERTLGQAVTGLDGTFSIAIPAPDTELTNIAKFNGGYLGVSINAILFRQNATAVFGHWMESLHLNPDLLSFQPPASSVSIYLEKPSLDLLGGGTQPPPFGCWEDRQTLNSQDLYTTIAELHSWDDLTTSYNNTYNASSDIDTGFSTDGSNWKLDGSVSVANDKGGSNGVEIPGRWGKEVQGLFTYHKDHVRINCLLTDSMDAGYQTEAWQAKPSIAWGGDNSYLDGPRQYVQNNYTGATVDFVNGYHWTKNQGTTQRYDSAASAFGFNYGVVSQYTSNFENTWKSGQAFQGRQDYHLWGDNHKNPQVAQTVYAWAGDTVGLTDTCVGTATTTNGSGSNGEPLTFGISFGCAYPIVRAWFGYGFWGDWCDTAVYTCPDGQPLGSYNWCQIDANGNSNTDQRCSDFPGLDGTTTNYALSMTRNIGVVAPAQSHGVWWGTSATIVVTLRELTGDVNYTFNLHSSYDPYTAYVDS